MRPSGGGIRGSSSTNYSNSNYSSNNNAGGTPAMSSVLSSVLASNNTVPSTSGSISGYSNQTGSGSSYISSTAVNSSILTTSSSSNQSFNEELLAFLRLSLQAGIIGTDQRKTTHDGGMHSNAIGGTGRNSNPRRRTHNEDLMLNLEKTDEHFHVSHRTDFEWVIRCFYCSMSCPPTSFLFCFFQRTFYS